MRRGATDGESGAEAERSEAHDAPSKGPRERDVYGLESGCAPHSALNVNLADGGDDGAWIVELDVFRTMRREYLLGVGR
jgi:hypothetical protein